MLVGELPIESLIKQYLFVYFKYSEEFDKVEDLNVRITIFKEKASEENLRKLHRFLEETNGSELAFLLLAHVSNEWLKKRVTMIRNIMQIFLRRQGASSFDQLSREVMNRMPKVKCPICKSDMKLVSDGGVFLECNRCKFYITLDVYFP